MPTLARADVGIRPYNKNRKEFYNENCNLL